jgi:hypothetical protein
MVTFQIDQEFFDGSSEQPDAAEIAHIGFHMHKSIRCLDKKSMFKSSANVFSAFYDNDFHMRMFSTKFFE